MTIEREDILHYLIHSVLLDRLELANVGYGPDDFSEATELLEGGNLSLDSVDALDLLVGIEKEYRLAPIEINGDFIEQHCSTIAGVIDMVLARLNAGAPSVAVEKVANVEFDH